MQSDSGFFILQFTAIPGFFGDSGFFIAIKYSTYCHYILFNFVLTLSFRRKRTLEYTTL
jgi:hypothetical protein